MADSCLKKEGNGLGRCWTLGLSKAKIRAVSKSGDGRLVKSCGGEEHKAAVKPGHRDKPGEKKRRREAEGIEMLVGVKEVGD